MTKQTTIVVTGSLRVKNDFDWVRSRYLTLCILCTKIQLTTFWKIGLCVSCKVSFKERSCKKCQIRLSGKNTEKSPFVEAAQKVLGVKYIYVKDSQVSDLLLTLKHLRENNGDMISINVAYVIILVCRYVFCTCSTKTYLYNVDPLKAHFYKVKLGSSGVYIIFLTSAQKT